MPTATHKIYMAAVPKNQALEMLLSGTVGYDATTAFVDGGEIVLSAGWTPRSAGNFSSWVDITEGAIEFTGGNFTSNVEAIANQGIFAGTTDGPLNFAGNVDFYGDGPMTLSASGEWSLTVGGTASLRTWDASAVTLTASGGGTLDIGGNANLSSEGVFNGDQMQGGTVNVTANGGTVDVAGTILADVEAWGGSPNTDGFSQSATGGTVTLYAAGEGTIIAGGLYALAQAGGGNNNGGGNLIGGTGTGGTVLVHSVGGSEIDINGSVTADASGDGGDGGANGVAGGTGDGGAIEFLAEGGTIDISGSITADAEGYGGTAYHTVDATAAGGTGVGGNVGLTSSGPGSLLLVGGAISLDGSAFGGSGHDGGVATGGVTWVESFGGGSIAITGGMTLYAQAHGGYASAGYGGDGGFGQGGVTAVEAYGAGSSITGSSVYLDAGAWGGHGGSGDGVEIAAGDGGDAQGGLYNGELGSGGAFLLAGFRGREPAGRERHHVRRRLRRAGRHRRRRPGRRGGRRRVRRDRPGGHVQPEPGHGGSGHRRHRQRLHECFGLCRQRRRRRPGRRRCCDGRGRQCRCRVRLDRLSGLRDRRRCHARHPCLRRRRIDRRQRDRRQFPDRDR